MEHVTAHDAERDCDATEAGKPNNTASACVGKNTYADCDDLS